jgi:hypothetical protein
MVVRAMGESLGTAQGMRIWLASEACRWLPGSVWSYGTRGFLAARAGVSPGVAAASLGWELALTILAWAAGAAAGLALWQGPMPPAVAAALRMPASWPWPATLAAVVALAVVAALGSKAVGRRLARFSTAPRDSRRVRTSSMSLIGVLLFYIGMVLLNALTFWAVVRSVPGGDRCPFGVVLAANSISWLVGFFALIAPGGLVVREASLGMLLSGWLTTEQALTVALAWRAIQIATELAGYLMITTWGLAPESSVPPASKVLTEGIEV